jgi:hypothetical protein
MTNVTKPRLGVLEAFDKIWKRGYFGNAFVPAVTVHLPHLIKAACRTVSATGSRNGVAVADGT